MRVLFDPAIALVRRRERGEQNGDGGRVTLGPQAQSVLVCSGLEDTHGSVSVLLGLVWLASLQR